MVENQSQKRFFNSYHARLRMVQLGDGDTDPVAPGILDTETNSMETDGELGQVMGEHMTKSDPELPSNQVKEKSWILEIKMFT